MCSGYKHFTLIDEKTSLPLSVRGAYIATTAPYLHISGRDAAPDAGGKPYST